VLRGFAARTQQSYVEAIYRMAKHYRRDPCEYSAQDVQAYLLHMVQERHLSYSTMNQAACAASFLYAGVLGRKREDFQIPMAKVPPKLPQILTREEIARLLAHCTAMQRMLLQTIYAAGLRISEACTLRRGSKAGNTFSLKSKPPTNQGVGCGHQPIGDTAPFPVKRVPDE